MSENNESIDNEEYDEFDAWLDQLWKPKLERDPKKIRKWAKKLGPYQEKELFQAWLKTIEPYMDLYFLDEKVHFSQSNPYTRQGLIEAETQFLEYYPDSKSVWRSGNPELDDLSWRFFMYLGEVFRHNFECRWINYPEEGLEEHGGPTTADPWDIDLYHSWESMLTATASRRTGTEWTDLFDTIHREYEYWKESGIPSIFEHPEAKPITKAPYPLGPNPYHK